MAYAYSNADVQERWRAELAVATELLRSGEGSLTAGTKIIVRDLGANTTRFPGYRALDIDLPVVGSANSNGTVTLNRFSLEGTPTIPERPAVKCF